MKKTNLLYLVIILTINIIVIFRGYFLINREFKTKEKMLKTSIDKNLEKFLKWILNKLRFEKIKLYFRRFYFKFIFWDFIIKHFL